MASFLKDLDSLVKEASLQVLIKMFESFSKAEISNTIDPVELIGILVSEIVRREPSATVKSAFCTLTILLVTLYHGPIEIVRAHLLTSPPILFMLLNEHVAEEQPELKGHENAFILLSHAPSYS